MSVLIKYETTEGKNRVVYQHFFPETLPEAEKAGGILVPSIPPRMAEQPFKDQNLYISLPSKNLYYEYVDRPLSDKEELEQLKAQNAQIIFTLVMNDLM